MDLSFNFDNSYAQLPEGFFARLSPTPVKAPSLIAINDALAKDLGLDPTLLCSHDGAALFAGNVVPDGAAPLAQAYAGHQFGGFVPQLGDGRAVLLGEIVAPDGTRHDLQLKGSGRTPFSRMGDGRSWLGPVLREYVVSEAMAALGVPTTRALAAVSTGETVVRDAPLPGAVLTRVASSHIRVGTFQFFAVRGQVDALRALTDHVIARHYPEAETALDLLKAVISAQANLVARWMGLGFIHGVMNTDNTTVSGETIDYGPCAFMDAYHPLKVFSSIDSHGRYAYARQPEVLVWNLAQLATSLLPLLHPDQDKGVEIATEAVHRYPDLYREAWLREFRAKIGLKTEDPGDADLIESLMTEMAKVGADFTNTFRGLADEQRFPEWRAAWEARLIKEGETPKSRSSAMALVNPAVIARNHRIEAVIQAGLSNDFDPFHNLNRVLKTPFDLAPENTQYADPPEPDEEVTQTFCGT